MNWGIIGLLFMEGRNYDFSFGHDKFEISVKDQEEIPSTSLEVCGGVTETWDRDINLKHDIELKTWEINDTIDWGIPRQKGD